MIFKSLCLFYKHPPRPHPLERCSTWSLSWQPRCVPASTWAAPPRPGTPLAALPLSTVSSISFFKASNFRKNFKFTEDLQKQHKESPVSPSPHYLVTLYSKRVPPWGG